MCWSNRSSAGTQVTYLQQVYCGSRYNPCLPSFFFLK